MNNHQRLMARKQGKPAGYVDGAPRGGEEFAGGGTVAPRLSAIPGRSGVLGLPGQMYRPRRPMLSRPAPIARPYAEGGPVSAYRPPASDVPSTELQESNALRGAMSSQMERKKEETPEERRKRLQDAYDRAAQDARDASPRPGKVYPGGKPYAKGGKVSKTMEEFEAGTLRSGSKHGPKVTNKDQALAIGLSEARKAGEQVKPRR
jgi:hypothetical protein